MVLLAVAVAGGAAGVALDRLVLLPRATPPVAPPSASQDRLGRTPNPEMRRRFSERMAKDLGLTPEQSVQVDSIMKRQFEAMRKASDVVRPTIDSLSRTAQAALDSVLTPTQREKVREMRQRGRERGRDGGRTRANDGKHDSSDWDGGRSDRGTPPR